MATPTYTPIASITLGSVTSSVTFSSISADYRDLVLVADITAAADVNYEIRLNGNSGSNYSVVRAAGNASTKSSDSRSADTELKISFSGFTKHQVISHLMDYSATDKHKTVISRASNQEFVVMGAGRYASTSAVTSLEVFNSTASDYGVGSTFALYGIEA